VTAESWRCPLCNALADDARQHLADVHGVGSGPDRFGLRQAARPARPTPRKGPYPVMPDPRETEDDPPAAADDEVSEPPLTWRKVPRPVDADAPGLPGRPVRLPARRTRPPSEPAEPPPAKPEPLPPEAAILRLICDTLDGVDAAKLHDRLLALPGVESATIDLYDRTIDLYLDHRKAAPRPLVALAAGRIRLPIRLAELHRAAPRGERLGDATRIYVVQ
jgi:hypothetical protein